MISAVIIQTSDIVYNTIQTISSINEPLVKQVVVVTTYTDKETYKKEIISLIEYLNATNYKWHIENLWEHLDVPKLELLDFGSSFGTEEWFLGLTNLENYREIYPKLQNLKDGPPIKYINENDPFHCVIYKKLFAYYKGNFEGNILEKVKGAQFDKFAIKI